VSTFRDYEHAGWEDAGVCSAYQDRLGPVVAQVIEPMLEAVAVGPSDSVLDVATGSGVVAAAAAVRGATAVGLDFSVEQVRRAAAAHPGIRFEVGEADALPFNRGTFDVVVSSFGVPHFPDPEAFFAESIRVLNPGGRFAFTVWAAPDRSKGFEIVYGAIQRHGSLDVGLPPGPNFFLYADVEQSTSSLTRAGFQDVRGTVVPQTWELRSPDDLFDSIYSGTVRAAALLKRQSEEALGRIRDSIRQATEQYTDDGRYRVPMPAVLVTGTRAPL
jgi:ubiquinone/menaquinone biosynthesis C-methylase UbiE